MVASRGVDKTDPLIDLPPRLSLSSFSSLAAVSSVQENLLCKTRPYLSVRYRSKNTAVVRDGMVKVPVDA